MLDSEHLGGTPPVEEKIDFTPYESIFKQGEQAVIDAMDAGTVPDEVAYEWQRLTMQGVDPFLKATETGEPQTTTGKVVESVTDAEKALKAENETLKAQLAEKEAFSQRKATEAGELKKKLSGLSQENYDRAFSTKEGLEEAVSQIMETAQAKKDAQAAKITEQRTSVETLYKKIIPEYSQELLSEMVLMLQVDVEAGLMEKSFLDKFAVDPFMVVGLDALVPLGRLAKQSLKNKGVVIGAKTEAQQRYDAAKLKAAAAEAQKNGLTASSTEGESPDPDALDLSGMNDEQIISLEEKQLITWEQVEVEFKRRVNANQRR